MCTKQCVADNKEFRLEISAVQLVSRHWSDWVCIHNEETLWEIPVAHEGASAFFLDLNY